MDIPALRGFSTSADYFHLDVALKSLWPAFLDLIAEMDDFVPRPISDYAEERNRELQNMRSMNPTQSDESFANYVDKRITLAASEQVQFVERFSSRFMTQYVLVATISHALCEATINAVLALGLAHTNCQELFSVIEKADIKEKWRVAPKSFSPNYELSAGTALFETLKHLTSRRNTLVHNKIHVRDGESIIIKGSKFERLTFEENVRWMRRFFSLPYDLSEHATHQLKDYAIFILDRSDPIQRAEAHKTLNQSFQPTASGGS